jgi:hypothetical protein
MANPEGFEAILKGLRPEAASKARKAFAEANEAASKIEERRSLVEQHKAAAAKAEADLQQDTADYAGTVAFRTKEYMAGPDGGLGALIIAAQHAKSRKVPGADQFDQPLAQAREAMQKAQASGNPQAVAAVAEQVRQTFGPILDRMTLGMSPAVKEKLLGEQPKGVSLGEGARLVDPRTGRVIAEGNPKEETRSVEVQAAEALAKGDKATYQRLLKVKAQMAAAGRDPDEAPTLTPAGLDVAAQMFAKTGQLPPMGMGKAGATVRQKIINRAAELNPGLDIASNKAGFEADKGALSQLQKQSDAVNAFEETAKKNIDIFLESAGKVVDTGSPFANNLARQVSGKMLGSKNQAAYDAARQVALNEVAKIVSNPNLAGQLSDAARKEVEAFNPSSATLAQSVTVMRVLKQDMANRKQSYADQIKAIKARISGQKPEESSAAPIVQRNSETGAYRHSLDGGKTWLPGKP